MISLAAPTDLFDMTGQAEAYFKKVGGNGSFSAQEFVDNWSLYLASGAGFILKRYVDGEIKEALGVMIWRDPFDGARSAGTVFWFAPNDGSGLESGMLFVEVEKRLKNLGVKRFYPAHPAANKAAASFLEKHGYRMREMSWSKEL